jgi:hypothetical protein
MTIRTDPSANTAPAHPYQTPGTDKATGDVFHEILEGFKGTNDAQKPDARQSTTLSLFNLSGGAIVTEGVIRDLGESARRFADSISSNLVDWHAPAQKVLERPKGIQQGTSGSTRTAGVTTDSFATPGVLDPVAAVRDRAYGTQITILTQGTPPGIVLQPPLPGTRRLSPAPSWQITSTSPSTPLTL